MDRTDVAELHYTCPIANAASICKKGILSHNAVQETAPKYSFRITLAATRPSGRPAAVESHVSCDDAYHDKMALEVPWPVTQCPDIFFQEESDVW
jgi:hypothetical protein